MFCLSERVVFNFLFNISERVFNGHFEEESSMASENDGHWGKMLETSPIHVLTLTFQVMGQGGGH